MSGAHHTLPIVRAGIDTYRQPVVYMRQDCHLCQSEGFSVLTRIRITTGERSIIATLNVLTDAEWLPPDTAGLSDAAWRALSPVVDDRATFSHPETPPSMSAIRAKVYGKRLKDRDFEQIVEDVVNHRLSDLDLAAFISSCAADRLDLDETIALTRAMKNAGKTLDWGDGPVLDKHCIGGLPGNRTTPIVVAIVAAAGFRIPKTSSRAITSPAGTADTMEAMAPVSLDIQAMRRVIRAEGGCIVWGGGLDLSPADDILIRIERPLDFDSEGQLVASVLSKKAAAGSTHVLIDMPIGPTAKVRSKRAADTLAMRFHGVASALDLKLVVRFSDGLSPVGRGIGPALEAKDVLAVLRRGTDAPPDLRDRALEIAGGVLDLGNNDGSGREQAAAILASGAAETKFMAICEAQGGFTEPRTAPHRAVELAGKPGIVTAIDNRRIARIAKLAGAPGRKTSGILLHAGLGDRVGAKSPLFEIHAETPGELAWARDFTANGPNPFTISEAER